MLLALPNEVLFGEVLVRASPLLRSDFTHCAHHGLYLAERAEPVVPHETGAAVCVACVYGLSRLHHQLGARVSSAIAWCLELRRVHPRFRDLIDQYAFNLWAMLATWWDVQRLARHGLQLYTPNLREFERYVRSSASEEDGTYQRVVETLDAAAFREAPAVHARLQLQTHKLHYARGCVMYWNRTASGTERRLATARRNLLEVERQMERARRDKEQWTARYEALCRDSAAYVESTVGPGKRARAMLPGVAAELRRNARLPPKHRCVVVSEVVSESDEE